MDLTDKVALVTGGASGIGKATVERLASEGVRVCVVDRAEDTGRAIADAVGGTFVAADVGNPEQVDAAFAHCRDALGPVDIAFLNAGIAIGHSDLTTLPDDLYRTIMRVNVDGVVFGARAAIREMVPRGSGAIVATASLAGLIPFPPDPVYDLTKHAVVGLIRSIAPTVAAHGITANCVNPGMTDTNIISPDAPADARGRRVPADGRHARSRTPSCTPSPAARPGAAGSASPDETPSRTSSEMSPGRAPRAPEERSRPG